MKINESTFFTSYSHIDDRSVDPYNSISAMFYMVLGKYNLLSIVPALSKGKPNLLRVWCEVRVSRVVCVCSSFQIKCYHVKF